MSADNLGYQYVLEIRKKDGRQELLDAFAVAPDWEPALEYARFSAICRDPTPPLVLDPDVGTIEPRWDARKGMPYLQGVAATIPREGLPPAAFEIPLAYFGNLATSASAVLVKSGKLAAGEIFQYLVCAYPHEGQPAASRAEEMAKFAVKPRGQVLDASDCNANELLADSMPCGSNAEEPMLAFMPRAVIEESVDQMARAGDKETGGILIGRLHRDPARRQLFLEVTAQIPARHAKQELTRLTFTPETWTAVDAALALRGGREMQLGWWHSHPASHWCDECPPEMRQRCTTAGAPSGDFFSAHDVALHRAVFPRAYSIALVISDGCGNAATPLWRLFGWRYGMVVPRGFHLLHAGRSSAAAVLSEGEKNVPS